VGLNSYKVVTRVKLVQSSDFSGSEFSNLPQSGDGNTSQGSTSGSTVASSEIVLLAPEWAMRNFGGIV
jgi:hypothetical protein